MLPFHAGMQYLLSLTFITFLSFFLSIFFCHLQLGTKSERQSATSRGSDSITFLGSLFQCITTLFGDLSCHLPLPLPCVFLSCGEAVGSPHPWALWGISLFQLLAIGSVQCGVSLPLASLYSCLLLQNLCSSLFFSLFFFPNYYYFFKSENTFSFLGKLKVTLWLQAAPGRVRLDVRKYYFS